MALSDDELVALGEELANTAAHIDAATHRLLSQIRVFDEGGGWAVAGALSCAHWLSWRIGMDLGAAREKVRVARKLGALPSSTGRCAAARSRTRRFARSPGWQMARARTTLSGSPRG